MNLDDITMEDIMDFLDIDKSQRHISEVRVVIRRLMDVMLPTIAESPQFIQFYKERYGRQ